MGDCISFQVMAQNKKERESDPTRDGMFDARMLMLLMQSLSSSEVSKLPPNKILNAISFIS